MLNKRSLLIAVALSSAAVAALLNVYAAYAQRTAAHTQRRALQRWEGEGGNVLDPAGGTAKRLEQAPERSARA